MRDRDQVIAMTSYTVGLKLRARGKVLTIEAEDALLAALKVKVKNPDAAIIYVRKSNKRGDRRHPHEKLQNETSGREADRCREAMSSGNNPVGLHELTMAQLQQGFGASEMG